MSERSGLPIPPAQITSDTEEFHTGLASGQLLLPRCERCATVIWYPRHHCPACGSNNVSWTKASGRGTIYSFTVVRKSSGAYADATPYVLAYVELDEGPRVLTNVVTEHLDMLRIKDPVEAIFDTDESTGTILRFRIVSTR